VVAAALLTFSAAVRMVVVMVEVAVAVAGACALKVGIAGRGGVELWGVT
jgi:hypothetical protein